VAFSQIKEQASVLQSKTRKPVGFEISDGTCASFANAWNIRRWSG
jgi:hypothetical protein